MTKKQKKKSSKRVKSQYTKVETEQDSLVALVKQDYSLVGNNYAPGCTARWGEATVCLNLEEPARPIPYIQQWILDEMTYSMMTVYNANTDMCYPGIGGDFDQGVHLI